MARRSFLRQLVALPFVGIASSLGQEASHKSLNIMMKSAWGSDDPTKAAFPFLHGLALSEAGHSVQIFMLGEAVSLSRHRRDSVHDDYRQPSCGGDSASYAFDCCKIPPSCLV